MLELVTENEVFSSGELQIVILLCCLCQTWKVWSVNVYALSCPMPKQLIPSGFGIVSDLQKVSFLLMGDIRVKFDILVIRQYRIHCFILLFFVSVKVEKRFTPHIACVDLLTLARAVAVVRARVCRSGLKAFRDRMIVSPAAAGGGC